MKKFLLLMLLLVTGLSIHAQLPRKFNYQAVVRNDNGSIIADQPVSIRFSIHDDNAAGVVQYSETHTSTTNTFGLINLQVGAGTIVSGDMASVTWSNGAKFLEIEIDVNGGANFSQLATVELAAVPYALHAGSTGGFTGTLAGDVTGAQQATSISNNAVTNTKIADNAITTAKIANNSMTSAKIADNAVTGAKMADDAVTTTKINDLAVTSAKIADNSVTSAKIADNAVTGVKMADDAVTTTKINDLAVTSAKIADNSVTSAKIADNAVTGAKMADDAVTTIKIANSAITGIKLADGSVTTVKIVNQSITAEKLADASVTNTKIADDAITAPKISAGQVVKSINGLHDDIEITGSGGTTISVAGNAITIGGASGTITGITAGAGLTGGGITGNVNIAPAFGGNGTANNIARSDHTHVGQTWSTNTGYMLRLFDNDANATPLYVNSYATGFSNAGISSQILATTGQSIGVFGNTVSTDAFAAGIFGQAYGNGAAKGVWGLAQGSNTFGIFGQAAGAGSWAGYFEGRVHVNGTLSKAAGSFRIDHPLDPVNKTLSHSFVESPDMMNVYNGNITLDANGEATVTLPDYFEALNRDFRYQLTAVGKPSPGIYISAEIAGNRFRVSGGTPGGKISWMVTGIRNDPYAQQHPIIVEQPKQGSERGQYLYPQVHKQGARELPKARVISSSEPPKND